MGDSRYSTHYERILLARDKVAAIQGLSDDEVVQALAAASRERDPYVANVLATEAMNRMRRARAIATNLPAGAFAVDQEGTFTFVNPAMVGMLGGAWSDYVGAPMDSRFALRDHAGAPVSGSPACPVRRCLEGGGPLEWDGRLARPDGADMDVTVIVAPIGAADDPDGAVVAFRDVTARRRADQQQEASRAALDLERHRLHAVLEQMPSGVVIAEAPTGRFALRNREAVHLLGEPLEGVDLAAYGRLGARHGDGAPYRAEEYPIARALRGETVRQEGMAYARPDGRVLRLAVNAAPVRDAEGRVVAAVSTFHDVTEAKRTEARLHGVLESLREGLLVFDPRGGILYMNPAAHALLGIPEGALPADPAAAPLGFETPEGRPLAPPETPVGVALREGRAVHDARLTLQTPHRGRRHFLVSAIPIEGGDVVASFEDVTDDLEAERRLRESEELHRHVVATVRDYAIFIVSLDGRILTWNEGARRIKGWTEEEVVGKPFASLFREEDVRAGVPEKEMRVAAEHGSFSSDSEVGQRKDGTTFPASVHLAALRDDAGRLRAFVKVTRDLTDLKRGEDALRRSEAQYRALVENSPEPMAVHAAGKLLFINRSGARLIGATEPEALLGRNVLGFVHPDSIPLVKERLARIHQSEDILPAVEERFLRLDGSAVDVETVAIPIVWEGQRAVQLIFRDITHRKAHERELERRVAERTAELKRALEDLETFSNSASHDLRAPLRGVEALLQDALEAFARGDATEARDLVEHAHREGRRAQRLVQDLLSFAKSGKAALHASDVDATALAHELAAAIDQTHPARATSWRIEPGMRVRADEGLLRIALHNLMDNASKYAARAAQPAVEVGLDAAEGARVLRVRDNGVGFPMTEAYRLFQTFARLSTAHGFEGTGLGLATVQRVAARHGGKVWAESEPGQGATFFLSLPE